MKYGRKEPLVRTRTPKLTSRELLDLARRNIEKRNAALKPRKTEKDE